VHQITQAPQLRYAPFGDRFHSTRKEERKKKRRSWASLNFSFSS